MNTITHFLFLKYIIENDIKNMNKPTKKKFKYKLLNNNSDNFIKYQWCWTL